MKDLSLLVQEVLDGNADPLEAFSILKDHEAYVQKCINEIKEGAMEEARKQSEKTFIGYGCKFEYRTGGARYDYSNIPGIVELETELKKLKKEAQMRCKVTHQVVSEDGEVLPKPIVKYSYDSLSVKKV